MSEPSQRNIDAWLKVVIAAYESARKRVVHDIQATTDVTEVMEISLIGSTMVRNEQYPDCSMLYDYLGHQQTMVLVVNEPEATVEVAYLAGEDLSERLQRDAGTPWASGRDIWSASSPGWPPCPEHGHRMSPELRDGRAMWCCRTLGTPLVEIGELARRSAQEPPHP